MALAAAGTAQLGHDPHATWYWRFRLLQAEGLSQQSRTKEAEALLADPVPGGLESGQLEGRRLVDQAALKSGVEAEKLLQRGRSLPLSLKLETYQGPLLTVQASSWEFPEQTSSRNRYGQQHG